MGINHIGLGTMLSLSVVLVGSGYNLLFGLNLGFVLRGGGVFLRVLLGLRIDFGRRSRVLIVISSASDTTLVRISVDSTFRIDSSLHVGFLGLGGSISTSMLANSATTLFVDWGLTSSSFSLAHSSIDSGASTLNTTSLGGRRPLDFHKIGILFANRLLLVAAR